MRQSTRCRAFTLIEITIAIAVLGLLASVVGWHLKKMVHLHNFRKHVALFVTDLKKLQLVALSRRCDLTLQIYEKKGQWFYLIQSDEPMHLYGKDREIALKGIKAVTLNNKQNEPISLVIHSNGGIDPMGEIHFHLETREVAEEKGDEMIALDLCKPLQIKLKYPEAL